MKHVLLVAVLALGLGSLAGCSDDSKSNQQDGVQAPPVQNSGADEKAPKGRFPAPPKD